MFSYQDIFIDTNYYERFVVQIRSLTGEILRATDDLSNRIVYVKLRSKKVGEPKQHATSAKQFADWVRKRTKLNRVGK